jgi:hypothetical protein
MLQKPTVSEPALEMDKIPLDANESSDRVPSEKLAENPITPEQSKAEPEKPDCPKETEKPDGPKETEKPKLFKEDLNEKEENNVE